MAREVIVRMTDDFDRTKTADEVKEIGWEGYIYTLDLTAKNVEGLRAVLEPYLKAAHEKVKWPKANRRKSNDPIPTPVLAIADKSTRQEIKEWAQNNGFDVNDRGRLPDKIIQAYTEAHRG